ncbi:polyketide cyclase [Rhodococcus oxybenzonivorans]|uniref:Polyketide cyclase n=1 Tax=Rhodococcus oxybenzonivorans TaxID=1990687 RepID=A0A2S2C2A7_9NOCA|nr:MULTISPECIES: SRPBCC family protein [Rhodococcus]AWK75002.1 polyketide cyclase [Rhodococcus oxybenzonivorans]QTJ67191.1 SRPBCC family protein [Rhodococcus sp. ZPP]
MSTSTPPTAATLTTPEDREIRVERIFNAPRERVWAAFTTPDLLAQWWGRGNRLDIERWEFERGGHWRFVEHSEGDTHGFEGRFREIIPMERLVYTFEWDGMPGHVTVDHNTYTDLGDGRTKLTVVSQFHTPEERDGMLQSGMEGGMNESYAALDAVLAQSTW